MIITDWSVGVRGGGAPVRFGGWGWVNGVADRGGGVWDGIGDG